MPFIMMKNVPAENKGYILGTRVMLLLCFAGIALMVKFAWDKRKKK